MASFDLAHHRVGAVFTAVAALLLVACGGGGSGGVEGSGSGSIPSPGTPPAPASHAGPVTVAVRALPERQYWLAYQDGDGTWALARKTDSGFSFDVTDKDGKYAVVLVDEPATPNDIGYGGPQILGFHFTRAEVPLIDISALTPQPASVHYSIVGAPPNPAEHTCAASVGTAIQMLPSCVASGFRATVGQGTGDAFLASLDSTGMVDSLIAKRDQSFTSALNLSFNFADAVNLGPMQTAQVAPEDQLAWGESYSLSAQLVAPNGRVRLNIDGGKRSLSYRPLPESLQRPSDFYLIGATAALDQGGTLATRASSYRSKSGLGQTIKLPSHVSPITFGLASGATAARPVLSWSPMDGSLMSNVHAQSDDLEKPAWDLSFSAGWIKGSKRVSYSFPDLSALGWKSSWYLARPSQVKLTYAERYTSNADKRFYLYQSREKYADETAWNAELTTTVNLP